MTIEKQKTHEGQDEAMQTLQRVLEENHHLHHLQYFLDLCFRWHSKDIRKRIKPPVCVIGTDLPEELIHAAGITPYWIIGGSHASTQWSEQIVPRDTDPVSRSILGFVHEADGVDFTETLFILPADSDSSRKMAYLLSREGRKVCVVDIPPSKDDPLAGEEYVDSIDEMLENICGHTGKRITTTSIRKGEQVVSQARYRLASFLAAAKDCEEIIHGSARMLVTGSYFYADDLNVWSKHLEKLTEEIRTFQKVPLPTDVRLTQERNTGITSRYGFRDGYERNTDTDLVGILLMGSPVIFPNYKIPFLIEDVGLRIAESLSVQDCRLKIDRFPSNQEKTMDLEKQIHRIAADYYRVSTSGAYTRNSSLEKQVREIIRRGNIEGVVFHILKGQIEHDFELLRYERLFEKEGIPVFRLETDYQYQDIEQLRIRMEAFSEMLGHYHLTGRKEAAAR